LFYKPDGILEPDSLGQPVFTRSAESKFTTRLGKDLQGKENIVHWLGIDVSKEKLDVCLLSQDSDKAKHRQFDNGQKGSECLLKWLKSHAVSELHVCMEPTATYGEAVAEYLHACGFTVSMVNPAKISAFAKALLKRAKTDKLDAEVIALFCKRMSPAPWEPQAEEVRHLRNLTRRLQTLKGMRQQEHNRLEGADQHAAASIARVLDAIGAEIELCELQIKNHVSGSASLKRQVKLLCTIPGIGATTAWLLLSEIGDANRFQSARHLAAFAGLVPRKEMSGRSINRPARMMKAGNVFIRKALFMPALVAAYHNPALSPVYQNLLQRGKSKMSAIGAIMRRLLHIVYGVLHHDTPFVLDHKNPSVTAI
jgi:transposase